jgi:hypothetical protein
MFMLRTAFWIVVVAFLIDGGSTTWTKDMPASAKESASHVVAAVGKARGFCDEHRTACDAAGQAFDFARREISAAAIFVGQTLSKDGKSSRKEG